MPDESSHDFGTEPNKALPSEVIAAIDRGVTPLLAVREWKGYSIEDLARIASRLRAWLRRQNGESAAVM